MKIFLKAEILEQVKDFLAQNPEGVLEILGPTASGKTGFSIELAQFCAAECGRNVEIISVDSRQVFTDCDISSAKITTEEMFGVPHHGIDLVRPDQPFNVVDFKRYALQTISEIQARGNVAVLCGGTMLWLDAISENYQFGAIENPDYDPVLSLKDPFGHSRFNKSTDKAKPLYRFYKIGLHWEREKLYERINQRSVLQFEGGMIEETQAIVAKYPQIGHNTLTSFGYQEILSYLSGKITLEEAIAQNQQKNRNYAKRQLTWWRGREDVRWMEP